MKKRNVNSRKSRDLKISIKPIYIIVAIVILFSLLLCFIFKLSTKINKSISPVSDFKEKSESSTFGKGYNYPVVKLKTFRSPEYNIEFQYPEQWQIEITPEGIKVYPSGYTKGSYFHISKEKLDFNSYLEKLEKNINCRPHFSPLNQIQEFSKSNLKANVISGGCIENGAYIYIENTPDNLVINTGFNDWFSSQSTGAVLSNMRILKSERNDIQNPYKFLPGFSIIFSKDWEIQQKSFDSPTDTRFKSHYFMRCSEDCSAIKLSKGNISLDLIFDHIYDDNTFKCSNRVDFLSIGSGWYRLKDSTGYFYARKLEINRKLGLDAFPSLLGSTTDEYSVIQNATYKFCLQGSGSSLIDNSTFTDGGILLENPRISGIPNETELLEIDKIILSVKGIN
jgi:hypothetical protein